MKENMKKDPLFRVSFGRLLMFKKKISSSNGLLSNNLLFGGQLLRRLNHERDARVIYLLTTYRQTVNYYS